MRLLMVIESQWMIAVGILVEIRVVPLAQAGQRPAQVVMGQHPALLTTLYLTQPVKRGQHSWVPFL